MIFEIVGAIAIGAFLAYLAWQIQRSSKRMEEVSDSLTARMDEMSNSLNARMDEMSNSLNARMDQIMLDVGEIKGQVGAIQGQVGAIQGQITVINHRLDENEKAHAAFAERIDELTATLHK